MTAPARVTLETKRTHKKRGGRPPDPVRSAAAKRRRDPCSRIGERFASLTILSVFTTLPPRKRLKYAVCRCVCGNETSVAIDNLISQNVRSCGCIRIKHGATVGGKPTLTYMVWAMLRNMCAGRGAEWRGSIGAAGFNMHEPWQLSFTEFLRDMGEAPPGHRLFRHDTTEHFIPGNCYWAPKAERKAAPLPQYRGMVVGRLTVMEPIDGDDVTASTWRARCECGGEVNVSTTSMKLRSRQSCGCLAVDNQFRTHGATSGGRPTKAYKTWSALRQRLVLKFVDQPEYAKRRADKFDSQWSTFEAFVADVGDAPDDGHLLVRIEDAAGFVRGNCIWYPKARMVQVGGGWVAKDRMDLLAMAKSAGLAAA